MVNQEAVERGKRMLEKDDAIDEARERLARAEKEVAEARAHLERLLGEAEPAPVPAAAAPKPAPKPAPKEEGVSEFVIDRLVHDYLLDALLGDEYDEADKRLAEYKIENDYSEVLEDVGGGYGDYSALVAHVVGKLKGYKSDQIAMGMKAFSEGGATMFDDYIETHLKPKPAEKQLGDEIRAGFKDEAKMKKLQDIITTSRDESAKREREITQMMTTIPAPKGTKAQIIEMIEEMITNPVDRLKLRLDKRDKGVLQTIYMNTKARYDWYRKNKPGQAIDYDLD
jgi:hypothetical protein